MDISDKATGISTERYDHGSAAAVRCAVIVKIETVKTPATEHSRDIICGYDGLIEVR